MSGCLFMRLALRDTRIKRVVHKCGARCRFVIIAGHQRKSPANQLQAVRGRMIVQLPLDVCCLNRPFDDQTQERVRNEATAVKAIHRDIDSRRWSLVTSEIIAAEISRTRDPDRQEKLEQAISAASRTVRVEVDEISRASELIALGFRPADALHIACAETAKVDVLLTTDDRLVRRARRLSANLKVRVANPVDWLQEVENP